MQGCDQVFRLFSPVVFYTTPGPSGAAGNSRCLRQYRFGTLVLDQHSVKYVTLIFLQNWIHIIVNSVSLFKLLFKLSLVYVMHVNLFHFMVGDWRCYFLVEIWCFLLVCLSCLVVLRLFLFLGLPESLLISRLLTVLTLMLLPCLCFWRLLQFASFLRVSTLQFSSL